MVQRRTSTLERLAESIGIEAALILCAFYGDRPTAYIPKCYHAGHLLERIVGKAAFLALIRDFGSTTIEMPQVSFEPERRLGAVYRGALAGQKTHEIADQLGISWRRVRQLEVAIQSGDPLTTAARRA